MAVCNITGEIIRIGIGRVIGLTWDSHYDEYIADVETTKGADVSLHAFFVHCLHPIGFTNSSMKKWMKDRVIRGGKK